MSDLLGAYLGDHLAGSVVAIHLLEELRDDLAGQPLSEFAATLLAEIQADRAVLLDLSARVVGSAGHPVKEATAWLAEKVSQLKLRSHGEQFRIFEVLETLALGIQGKRALWRALAVMAEVDTRLRGVDYAHLIERARSQYDEVEKHRLDAARALARQR